MSRKLHLDDLDKAVLSAVDSYAKQTAVDVLEYVLREHILARDTTWFDAGNHLTSEQVYQQYQQQKEGK